MVSWIIEWSAKHKAIVIGVVLALCAWAIVAARQTPLDALPDLSDPQVIVYTEWMGRNPNLVEEQITYPMVRALQSTPGVRSVRGYSMFGMSFVYVIFEDNTDIYWARTRVLEQMGRVRQNLPSDVEPVLGPDATGIGWVYEYVVEDTSGTHDLAQLRELQDYTIRPALQAVSGVAEVASVGGFERQYQVVVDPNRLAAYNLALPDVTRAVRDANAEVGARVLEMAGREYILRGRGYVRSLADLEQSVVALGPGGTPVRLRDVARVQFGPEIRRGATDWNGRGEAVAGIVVMRVRSNARDVIQGVRTAIGEMALPPGVRIVPAYDRSELIDASVSTLRKTLIEEGLIDAFVCILFLMHLRSALVAIVVMPVAVLLAFIPMRYLGLSTNLMSLGGIAIAVGELSDAAIVMIENAHVRLAEAPKGADRQRVVIDAAKEVGKPIFFSLLLITVSFLPIFTLAGQAGRLFLPLALTKTFAVLAAAVLSITLVPPLMVLLVRGRIRTEAQNPVTRVLQRMYEPIVRFAVRRRLAVVAVAAVAMVGTVPIFLHLGSEFLPPLDEGTLLVMPTTFPGISIEEARRTLIAQDQRLMQFGEIDTVFGKVGRAETATDPAQLEMTETVIQLRPRSAWPRRYTARWYSGWAPRWLRSVLTRVWSDQQPRTLGDLERDLLAAIDTPGYQMAIAPPIRTRVDMLTTGVRTPVGLKVSGPDLEGVERISIELERLLRGVRGARSTLADRQTGREYIDITPNRETIARYGLTERDVFDVVESAIGGMPVSTVIAGRARFSVNVRYAAGFRSDPEALRRILVPVVASAAVGEVEPTGAGAGTAATPGPSSGGGSMGAGSGGMGGSSGMGAGGAPSMSPASSRTMSGAADAPSGGGWLDAWRPRRAVVTLGELADIRVVTGPPMIRDENGVLTGYVYIDVDTAQRDIGGFVDDARALVAARVHVPPGYRLQWTGQYEYLSQMQERMKWVLPITLVLIVLLVRVSMRGWPQTALALASVPFAFAGSVWLLSVRHYNVSTAVWVGLIAVMGAAAEIGSVMIVYLDQAIDTRLKRGGTLTPADIDEAIIDSASRRARILLMTAADTIFGLLPLLWEAGVGADITARTAAPVVGGLTSCMMLTVLVLPAAYAMWRRHQLQRGTLVANAVDVGGGAPPASGTAEGAPATAT